MKKINYLLTRLIVIYLVFIVFLALFIYRASPAPQTAELRGVGLGKWRTTSGMTLFSGRRLDCTTVDVTLPDRVQCEIEIAGKPLIIRTQDIANNPYGGCTAEYNNQDWPCLMSARHVDVDRFAYINPPLDLTKSQLQSIRRQYYFENLPETPFVQSIFIVSSLNAILFALKIGLSRWILNEKWYLWLLYALPIGIITYFLSGLAMVLLTRGFWD